jgi:hypothetical protein
VLDFKIVSNGKLSLLLATIVHILKHDGISTVSTSSPDFKPCAADLTDRVEAKLQSQILEQVEKYDFNDLAAFYMLAFFTRQTISTMRDALVSISMDPQYTAQSSISTLNESVCSATQILAQVSARLKLTKRRALKSHSLPNVLFILFRLSAHLPILYLSITRLAELGCLP